MKLVNYFVHYKCRGIFGNW